MNDPRNDQNAEMSAITLDFDPIISEGLESLDEMDSTASHCSNGEPHW